MKNIFLFLLLFPAYCINAQDDGSKQSEKVWPISKFYFSVEFGSSGMIGSFQEVAGLDVEAQVIEYRAGNDPTFSTVKMPGLKKADNVTLKKGMFKNDNQFYGWYSSIQMNTIKSETVTIRLLDEEGSPVMIWTLQNAWVTKIAGTDLQSDANEVAIETIELAHEGLTIGN